MDSLTFTILVVVLTGEGVYLATVFLVAWRRNAQDVPLLFVLVSAFVVSLPPAYYVLFTGRFEAFQFGYPLSTWCLGLVLEIVFFAVFIITLILKRSTPQLNSIAGTLDRLPRSGDLLLLLVVLSGIAYVWLWGPWSTNGYEAAGRYIQDSLSNPDVTVNSIQNTIFRTTLFPAVCVLLFYTPRRAIPIAVFPFLWTVFAYFSLTALISGGRGAILEVGLAIGSCLFAAGKRLRPFAYVVGSFLFLALFTSAIVNYRENTKEYVGMSPWDKVRILVGNSEVGGEGSDFQYWAENYLTRLDAIQDGGILAEETANSHRFAYLRPFVGAFLAPVPRHFWGAKPLPLSDNDAVSGLPWYRVMQYRGTPWNNGGVSTSGVAYWQFGWPGVIFTAVLGALLLRFLSALLVRGGAIGLLFFLSFCMMTHFRLPVGVDETIFVFAQILLPLAVACFFYLIPARVIAREEGGLSPSGSLRGGVQAIGP